MTEVYYQPPLFVTPEDIPNARKRKKFPIPKPGHRFCNTCDLEMPFEQFHLVKGKPASVCKECTRARDRARDPIRNPRKTPIKPLPTKEGHKVCNTCFKEKPLEAFMKTSIFKDGYAGRCRQCNHDLREARTDEEKERDRTIRRASEDTRREQIRAYNRLRAKLPHRRAASNERARVYNAKKAEARRITRLNAPPITNKICPKCNIEKPLSAFALNKNRRDGHSSYCKECVRAYQGTEIAKARKNARKREKMLDPGYRQSAYGRLNKWRRDNPLGQREYTLRRNARKKAAAAGRVSYKRILERDGMFCYICQSPIGSDEKMDFDHVIPLSRGGAHHETNIRVSHMTCNRRKAAKLIEELQTNLKRTNIELCR